MAQPSTDALSGIVIDDATEVTVTELSLFCAVPQDRIVALVDEGILEPLTRTQEEWRFAGQCLRRAATALRLQRDLDIHLPAVAVILDLLDQIETLRRQIPR